METETISISLSAPITIYPFFFFLFVCIKYGGLYNDNTSAGDFPHHFVFIFCRNILYEGDGLFVFSMFYFIACPRLTEAYIRTSQ